jgi:hypothetical protein
VFKVARKATVSLALTCKIKNEFSFFKSTRALKDAGFLVSGSKAFKTISNLRLSRNLILITALASKDKAHLKHLNQTRRYSPSDQNRFSRKIFQRLRENLPFPTETSNSV